MLVLTRKVEQVIVIGEGEARIEVMVVEVKGGKVRLGVKAPAEQKVVRKELLECPAA